VEISESAIVERRGSDEGGNNQTMLNVAKPVVDFIRCGEGSRPHPYLFLIIYIFKSF